ncbi:hypothetical protein [Gymnodinialimonas sp.]
MNLGDALAIGAFLGTALAIYLYFRIRGENMWSDWRDADNEAGYRFAHLAFWRKHWRLLIILAVYFAAYYVVGRWLVEVL